MSATKKNGDNVLSEIELIAKTKELYEQIEEFLKLARTLPEFVELEAEFCYYLVDEMKTMREIFDMNFSFNKNRCRIGNFLPSIVKLINGEIESGEIYQFGLLQIWEKTKEEILAKYKI